jgi:hypothetical protein
MQTGTIEDVYGPIAAAWGPLSDNADDVRINAHRNGDISVTTAGRLWGDFSPAAASELSEALGGMVDRARAHVPTTPGTDPRALAGWIEVDPAPVLVGLTAAGEVTVGWPHPTDVGMLAGHQTRQHDMLYLSADAGEDLADFLSQAAAAGEGPVLVEFVRVEDAFSVGLFLDRGGDLFNEGDHFIVVDDGGREGWEPGEVMDGAGIRLNPGESADLKTVLARLVDHVGHSVDEEAGTPARVRASAAFPSPAVGPGPATAGRLSEPTATRVGLSLPGDADGPRR